jgi:hypothetical protein
MSFLHESDRHRVNARLGTLLLLGGVAGLVLCLFAQSDFLPGVMLRIWSRFPAFWWVATFGMFAGGFAALWSSGHSSTEWKPRSGGRRFESAVLYTKHDCPLCDDARFVLQMYRRWLPPIREIDIDIHPDFQDAFSKCVPVLELDDEIRFRGRINETLLQRLLEGTPPAETTATRA